MLNKNVTVILKDGGGAPSTSKKKKKEEEKKTVAVIKSDTPASRLREVARDSVTEGVANRDSAQTGVRTQSYAESRQPTPTAVSHGTSLKREANGTPTPTTQKREFTYDDYITATAAEKAKGMLGRYFKTGEIPSNLPVTLKERLPTTNASRLREGDHEVVEGVGNRTASNTGNTSPIPTKPDYSSPTAAWRNPETFQAIPWSDYEGLNKYDRKAYLKAYAENSQKEKAQRDAMAQAEAQRLNQEKSDKMLADHFYGRMLKGEQIDVKVLEPKTLGALQDRAYEDYSKGAISYDQYIDLPIHVFKSLDNGQAKVYGKTPSYIPNVANDELLTNNQNHGTISAESSYNTSDTTESVTRDFLYPHFEGRIEKNGEAPSYEEISDASSGWRLVSPQESVFHDNGIGLPEEKYVHPDGREFVYDGDTHQVITDPRYMGTYNYGTYGDFSENTTLNEYVEDIIGVLEHSFYDVLPYLLTFSSNTRDQYYETLAELIAEAARNPVIPD